MTDLLEALRAPFPPAQVSWRVGPTTKDKKRGMALAYIDSRDVMDRLDEVCGAAGWQCTYPHVAGKTVCNIGIKIGDEWIWKADGAGDTDMEAEKGALSDAFKRAAVKWGIGRYLYDVQSPWVEIVPAGQSYAIADHEVQRLRGILAGKAPERPVQPRERQSAPPQRNGAESPPASPAPSREPMLRAIEQRATSVALDRMTHSADWREDYLRLSDADKRIVDAAIEQRRQQLARAA